MRGYTTKAKQIIFLLLSSIVCGIIVMVACAGYHYYRAGDAKGKQSIDNSYISASDGAEYIDGKYKVPEKGGRLLIQIPRKYINKMSFEYSSELFSGGTIEVDKENIYGVVEQQSICDEFLKDMPRSVVNINGRVSEIEITFEESHNQVVLWNFSIDNSFKMNPLLMVFTMSVTFLLGFLVFFRRENARTPAIAIFVSIIVVSTCLLIIQPSYIVGWDEQIHYKNAYMLGVSEQGEAATLAEDYLYAYPYQINTFSQPAQESVEERLDIIKNFEGKTQSHGVLADNDKIQISSAGYIFQALALKLGNFFNFPFYIIWLMGKLSNVLLYALVMSFAVHIVPVGKRLLMVFAMMPTLIFQSTTYTYDITVTAFVTLAICILIREFIFHDEVFRYRWRILFIISLMIGCLPKAVYAPLILGGLFLGKDKFYSNKDRGVFKGVITLGFIGLMSTFVLPTLVSPAQVGDTRGGDTSEATQMQYVLGKPIAYAIVLIKNVLKSFGNYILGSDALCHFAYLGVGSQSAFFTALLAGVTLTDTYGDVGQRRKVLPLRIKVVTMIQIFTVIALIWTALYLSFTEVGVSTIAGVQARYYFPFLFLFYLCFQTDKIKNYFSKENYQLVVMGVSSCLIFQQLYELVLVPKCF